MSETTEQPAAAQRQQSPSSSAPQRRASRANSLPLPFSLSQRTGRAASLCLVFLFWCAPIHGAAFEFVEPKWDSTTQLLDIAREELGRARVVLAVQLDWEKLQPKDGVLILHPTTRVSYAETSAFLKAGGRMAMLDDFGRGDELLTHFHVQRISAPTSDASMHLDNPHLLVAHPAINGSTSSNQQHPIVRDVRAVVVNHSSALRTNHEVTLTPVLEFPSRTGPATTFALVGVIGDATDCGLTQSRAKKNERCGRLFAMGDPSVFINLMMEFEGNRRLAAGLVRYLVEDDVWGKRSGRLYILVNRFHQTGHFGGQNDLQRTVASSLNSLEDWVRDAQKKGLSSRWAILLSVAVALLAAIGTWQNSGQLYRRPHPRYSRSTPLVAQGGVAGRAAVLAAPTTHDALAMAELKTAAQEYLTTLLRLPTAASDTKILGAIEARGALDPKSLKTLATQFEVMASAEQLITTAQPGNLAPGALTTLHQHLEEVLPKVRRDNRHTL